MPSVDASIFNTNGADVTPTIRKIEQLIALACSTTHEEEARTAAVAAVRLIQQHQLTIVDRRLSPAKFSNPMNVPDWFRDIMNAEMNRYRPAREPSTRPNRDTARPPSPDDEDRKPPNHGRWKVTPATRWCHGCSRRIEAGTMAYRFDDQWWCQNH